MDDKHLSADLRNAVIVGHHPHYVVQRQERIALDFRVDVLPLGACRQQLHKGDVVGQGAALIPTGSLGAHHVEEDGKRSSVVVEYQHILTPINQLKGRKETLYSTFLKAWPACRQPQKILQK